MIHEIYSIQDTKSQTYNPPFYQKNAGEAVRTFDKLVNDPNSILCQYPSDFVLIKLGQFCDDTGEIIPGKPVVIGSASQYVRSSSSVAATKDGGN